MRRLVVALLAMGAVVMASAPGAGAQEPGAATTDPPGTSVVTGEPSEAGGAAQSPPGEEGEGESGGEGATGGGAGGGTPTYSGNLWYEDEAGDRVPVEGVAITVESPDGAYSESDESDAEGDFEVPIPEEGRYRVSLDEDTLPEEVTVSNERPVLTLETRGTNTVVRFPLSFGDIGGRDVATTGERAARLAFQGIRFGLIVAICAIGLSLVFGTTHLVNFSHAEMVTFGGLACYFFNVTIGWHMIPAALMAIAVAVVVGGLYDRFFWRPLRNRGTGLIAMLVISIGAGIFFRYLFNFQFGGHGRSFRQYVLQTDRIEFGPISTVPRDLISMALSIVVLVLVALFLQRTRTGKAMRAVADNRDLAESSGINVDRVVTLVWAAGAGLAALGGILHALAEDVTWQMGFQLLLLIFAGVILGGLGTAYGALVGSMVVGFVVEMSTLFIPSEFKTVTALVILVAILLVRPQGILGQAERIG